MDNVTSTLTTVVFLSNWSWMFALYYVRCVVILNWKLLTTEKWQHRFGITRNITCVLIHACVLANLALHSNTLQFFQLSFAWSLKNISPIISYRCNIWCYTKYLIFLHLAQHVTFPEWLHSPGRMVCLCSQTLKGVSQYSSVAWCNTSVWCRTCTVRFLRSLLRIFSSFQPIWVFEMKVLWKVASSYVEDLKTVFILSWVQHEEFYYDKATCCKSFMQLLIQDVYSISSKTCQMQCMLFVDCLLVIVRIFC